MNRIRRLTSPFSLAPVRGASLLLCATLGAAPLACGGGQGPEPGGSQGTASEPNATTTEAVSVDSCTPGETKCDGVCVYTQSDGSNCGKCGHSCQGGACTSGVCQAFALNSDLYYPTALAVHGSDVYVAESSASLMKVSLMGGTPSSLASVSAVEGISVDSGVVYFSDYGEGSVDSVPIGGGTVTTLANGQEPWGLAVGDGNVYWTNYGDDTVMTAPSAGGSVSEVASGQSNPRGLAFHSGTLFWANYASGNVQKLHGAKETTFVAGQGDVYDVAVDGNNVYWATYLDGGAIMQAPLKGSGVTTLASGLYYPRMAVDGTSVYFLDTNTSSSVVKIPVGGGTITTLAVNQQQPAALVVDDTSVYWVTYASSGTVMKVAKD